MDLSEIAKPLPVRANEDAPVTEIEKPEIPAAQTSPIRPWRTKSSRRLLHDQWLTVRADDCVTADGVEISPYYVIEYPDWAVVVALDSDDNLVLVEQYRHALGVVSLELPGGGVDADDADPVAAAARELREETGFVAKRWQYVGRLAANPASQTNLCHIVLAFDAVQVAGPLVDPKEEIHVLRMPVRDVITLALEGRIVQSIHVAALTMALHKAGKWQP